MTSRRRERIRTLLKGIETGDPGAVAVVHPDRYTQHNPETREGGEGLAALFERLAQTNPRVNVVRIFSDGDFVFAHTEYEFSTSRVGFEVFRFEGDLTVEHWDNIQSRKGPNPFGHTMVDGPAEAVEIEKTEDNRSRVRAFVEKVLIGRRLDRLEHYVDDGYTEHNPRIGDGVSALRAALAASPSGGIPVRYERLHRLLAQGNFVLYVCEGTFDWVHSSFYDLYLLSRGKVVEHWVTTEAIPPRAEWKNDNGKF